MKTKIMNISKHFNKSPVLTTISLEIGEGEFIAILGPSGCGKTTLLRLLAGFEKPTGGSIYIDGQEVASPLSSSPPEKRNLGMVFQSFALWPHMSVKEHIAFPLKHQHAAKNWSQLEKEQRIKEVLQSVELDAFAHRFPNELSGGQRQRVALARAIAPKPSILLMDEPLSNLDAELKLHMRSEIGQLHYNTKAAIVYVTHDQSEALAMADRIVVMNKGRIEQVGTPQEIYNNPVTPFVATFVGKANLLEGKWEGEYFRPKQAPQLLFRDYGIASELKEKHLYPLRPEQTAITTEINKGIAGTVRSVQFQGKDIHYMITCDGIEVVVHEQTGGRKYHIGEQIAVLPSFHLDNSAVEEAIKIMSQVPVYFHD